MIVKLLTERHLEFLSLKGGCTGSSESTLVKMSNCWKSHALAQILTFLLRASFILNSLPAGTNYSWSLFILILFYSKDSIRSTIRVKNIFYKIKKKSVDSISKENTILLRDTIEESVKCRYSK